MKLFVFAASLMLFLLSACHRKSIPEKTDPPVAETKPAVVYKAPVKTATPKFITVNDAVAKKAANGRLY